MKAKILKAQCHAHHAVLIVQAGARPIRISRIPFRDHAFTPEIRTHTGRAKSQAPFATTALPKDFTLTRTVRG